MEGTAEPGRYSLSKTPWVREILQTLDNPHVRLVAFQSSRQVGKTTSGQMWFGRTVCHDASPFLLVQADGQVIKKFVRERIWPFIDATPELRELKDSNRDNWNLEDMHFDSGMWLNCVGARSIMGLSQRAIKRIWFEECNKYKTAIGDHSDPMREARHCTNTFHGGTVYASSTPTTEHGTISLVVANCEEERWWFVECPHCGHEFTTCFHDASVDDNQVEDKKRLALLKARKFDQAFEQLFKFETHSDESGVVTSSWWECEGCGERIDESEKRKMQEAGRFKAVRKLKSRKAKEVAFVVSGLNSLAANMSWNDIAEEYIKAKAALNQTRPNPIPMRNFKNNIMGITYEQKSISNDHEKILARRTGYSSGEVPADVSVLVSFCDRHGADYHYTVFGFRYRDNVLGMHLIQHGVIPKTFEMLTTILGQKFKREDGIDLPIHITGMDSGYQTEEVFSLCRQTGGAIVPVSGVDSDRPRPWFSRIDPKLPDSAANQFVNNPVDTFKNEIAGMLEVPIGEPGSLEFNSDIDVEFARHMVGQERVDVMKTDTAGRQAMRHVWQDRSGFSIHFWDCTVGCLGLAYAKSVDVMLQQQSGQEGAQENPPEPEREQRGGRGSSDSWLGTSEGGWI
tara:strand:+ start:836 stop:2710 length:1875 start_codon:yes stop_codon:yes gene_type:complete